MTQENDKLLGWFDAIDRSHKEHMSKQEKEKQALGKPHGTYEKDGILEGIWITPDLQGVLLYTIGKNGPILTTERFLSFEILLKIQSILEGNKVES
ncbi:MAG: hypothetical protein WC511_01740 [Candidatus Pacearchaeota archaeon]